MSLNRIKYDEMRRKSNGSVVKKSSGIQSTTKMQMLLSGIAEPPPPDPFAMPMSRYKEIRLKSTKELMNKHRISQGKTPERDFARSKNASVMESLYTTTA